MVTAPKIKKALVLRMFLGIKKTETPIFQGISVVLPKLYLGGRDDRSRIIDSQCEWGIRIVLLAKNNPLDCFLNAQTYRFDSSFSMHNKKGTLKGTFSAVVEMTGVEPAASTSRTWRATICATSRYFIVNLYSIVVVFSVGAPLRGLRLKHSRSAHYHFA